MAQRITSASSQFLLVRLEEQEALAQPGVAASPPAQDSLAFATLAVEENQLVAIDDAMLQDDPDLVEALIASFGRVHNVVAHSGMRALPSAAFVREEQERLLEAAEQGDQEASNEPDASASASSSSSLVVRAGRAVVSTAVSTAVSIAPTRGTARNFFLTNYVHMSTLMGSSGANRPLSGMKCFFNGSLFFNGLMAWSPNGATPLSARLRQLTAYTSDQVSVWSGLTGAKAAKLEKDANYMLQTIKGWIEDQCPAIIDTFQAKRIRLFELQRMAALSPGEAAQARKEVATLGKTIAILEQMQRGIQLALSLLNDSAFEEWVKTQIKDVLRSVDKVVCDEQDYQTVAFPLVRLLFQSATGGPFLDLMAKVIPSNINLAKMRENAQAVPAVWECVKNVVKQGELADVNMVSKALFAMRFLKPVADVLFLANGVFTILTDTENQLLGGMQGKIGYYLEHPKAVKIYTPKNTFAFRADPALADPSHPQHRLYIPIDSSFWDKGGDVSPIQPRDVLASLCGGNELLETKVKIGLASLCALRTGVSLLGVRTGFFNRIGETAMAWWNQPSSPFMQQVVGTFKGALDHSRIAMDAQGGGRDAAVKLSRLAAGNIGRNDNTITSVTFAASMGVSATMMGFSIANVKDLAFEGAVAATRNEAVKGALAELFVDQAAPIGTVISRTAQISLVTTATLLHTALFGTPDRLTLATEAPLAIEPAPAPANSSSAASSALVPASPAPARSMLGRVGDALTSDAYKEGVDLFATMVYIRKLRKDLAWLERRQARH